MAISSLLPKSAGTGRWPPARAWAPGSRSHRARPACIITSRITPAAIDRGRLFLSLFRRLGLHGFLGRGLLRRLGGGFDLFRGRLFGLGLGLRLGRFGFWRAFGFGFCRSGLGLALGGYCPRRGFGLARRFDRR